MSRTSDRNRRTKRLMMRREQVLAEMIANAETLGLKFTKGTPGISYEGDRYRPFAGKECCAIGAYMACKTSTGKQKYPDAYVDFEELSGLAYEQVYSGNDGVDDDQSWGDPDEAVGVAYRAYHSVSR